MALPEFTIPFVYAIVIGVKVLLPPNSNNKLIKLLEAECNFFTHCVSQPTIEVAPIKIDPNKISAVEEMRMNNSPAIIPQASSFLTPVTDIHATTQPVNVYC